MAATIRISHPDTSQNTQTQISQPQTSTGITSIPVYDTTGFSQFQFIVLDTIGTNNAEMVQITGAISSQTALTTGATVQPHALNANVVQAPFNQIRVYSSPTGTSGTFSLIATIAITWNQTQTTYIDAAGTSTYAYKVSYYNSYTLSESTLSSAITPDTSTGNIGGYSPNALYNLRYRLRQSLNDKRSLKWSDQELILSINVAATRMQFVALKVKEDYGALPMVQTNFVANQQEYTLPADFYEARYVATTIDLTNYIYAQPTDMVDVFDYLYATPVATPVASSPYIYFSYYIGGTGGNSIGFYPPPLVGNFKLWYYNKPKILVNDTDTLLTPLDAYTDVLLDGAREDLYIKGGSSDMGKKQEFHDKFEEGLARMRQDLKDRQIQKPKRIKMSDVGFMDSFYF